MLIAWRGYARVALGDANGLKDMCTRGDTLANHGHRLRLAYGNLADTLRGLGDCGAAEMPTKKPTDGPRRVASNWHIDWIAGATGAPGLPRCRLGHAPKASFPRWTPPRFQRSRHLRVTADASLLPAATSRPRLADAEAIIAYAEAPATTTISISTASHSPPSVTAPPTVIADDASTNCASSSSAAGMRLSGMTSRADRTLRNRTNPRQRRATRRDPRPPRFAARKPAAGATHCSSHRRPALRRCRHPLRTDRQPTSRRRRSPARRRPGTSQAPTPRGSAPRRGGDRLRRAHRSPHVSASRRGATEGLHVAIGAMPARGAVRGGARQPDQASTSLSMTSRAWSSRRSTRAL